MEPELVRIVAPHFVAGYDLRTGNIAPIIRYLRGRSLAEIARYCSLKNWRMQVLDAVGWRNYG